MGYNIKQKIEICLKAEANPEMTQGELAQWAMHQYGLAAPPAQTTISRILSSKNDLIASKSADFKLIRRRKQLNPLLRSILTEWITQALWEGIPITTPIIQLTAHAIWTRLPLLEKDGKGVFNHKWCNHFLKKLNVNLRGDNADIMSNPGGQLLNKVWKLDEKLELKNYIRKLIEQDNYSPQDIFTLDEFQLFYSLPLDQIFDVSLIDKGLKQLSSSTENSVTIMLGANIDGSEKLTPLVVGKYDKFDVSKSSHIGLRNFHQHPHVHGNTNHHSESSDDEGDEKQNRKQNSTSKKPSTPPIQTLMNKITEVYNLYYKSNTNKWITSSMFQNYLLTLEHKLASNSPDRKIVILLDDSSSHRIINLKFSNIRLCYLKNDSNHKNPSNSTSNGVRFDYLPMSFGIIEEFRILYRLQQYLEMINIQRNKQQQEMKQMEQSNDKLEVSNGGGDADGTSPAGSLLPLTSSSISLYKPDLASLSTLTEADFDIPLIKVIEWIKRSWDSISPERIFLSWRRTHLINFTQTWPATDSNVIMKSFNILQPILKKASIYNTTKSYGKLVEVMGYLNVVIPWKVDELLGLVNESGKITLSYASIEEIIGSCLLESYDKVTETAAAAAASATAASAEGEAAESTVGTVAARTTTEVAASSSGIANTPSGLTLPNSINNRITAPRTNNGNSNGTLDWSDPQFDVNYLNNSNLPSVSNINNSAMNIKSLLAATSHDINEQQQQQQQQNSRGYFLDPSTLPPLISSPYGKFPSTQPDNYWHSSEKRRRINSPHHPPPPLLTTPRPGNTPVVGISATTPISQSMTMSTQAPGTGFRSQNGNKNFDAMSFDFKSPMSANRALHGQSPSTFHQSPNLEAPGNDLIQNLTRIIQASDSGEGIQLSSTTLEELRNTLQQAQSRPFKGNP